MPPTPASPRPIPVECAGAAHLPGLWPRLVRASSRGIEVAVKVWSPVTPPGQAAACLVDVVEIDLGHQKLRPIHGRLLHDASTEGIDDRAHADVTAAVLLANPIGGDHEHAIVEGARL